MLHGAQVFFRFCIVHRELMANSVMAQPAMAMQCDTPDPPYPSTDLKPVAQPQIALERQPDDPSSHTPVVSLTRIDTARESPMDAQVQSLMHDPAFAAAVSAGQVRAAAEAAVAAYKRHKGLPEHAHRNGAHPSRPRGPLGYGTAARGKTLPSPASPGDGAAGLEPWQRDLLRGLTLEILAMEESVPWGLVRRYWRTKRTGWRRALRVAEGPADLVARLRELRAALLADDAALATCGEAWQAELDACAGAPDGLERVAGAWDELRACVAGWLEGPRGATPAPPLDPRRAAACVARAVAAARAACAAADPADALAQLPVEAILCHDAGALGALGAALEAQRAGKPEEPGLDSGLESGEDGDATDLDPCFD
ncbi:hypothetical protein ACKKBG_A38845 [Auxenochlorella protothecoides x Auxenochlorella symbiontica]